MNATHVAAEGTRAPTRRRMLVAAAAVVLAIGVAWYLLTDHGQPPGTVASHGMHAIVSEPAAPLAPAPSANIADLPVSDAELSSMIAKQFGLASWPAFAYPDNILRRLVATVDALPRSELPTSIRVVRPVQGTVRTSGGEDSPHADAANAARYELLIAALEQISPSAAGDLYARLYPRLQQQYASLGFPDRSFHKRLLEALDDVLAAPTVPENVLLARPNVLFLYADPAVSSVNP